MSRWGTAAPVVQPPLVQLERVDNPQHLVRYRARAVARAVDSRVRLLHTREPQEVQAVVVLDPAARAPITIATAERAHKAIILLPVLVTQVAMASTVAAMAVAVAVVRAQQEQMPRQQVAAVVGPA